MKSLVLVALLAGAGCSKSSADCDAAFDKSTAGLLSRAGSASQELQDSLKEVAGKMRIALAQRCKTDKWPAEVVECFTKLTSQSEMQSCESKLSADQRTKMRNELMQVMTSIQLPGAGLGHPPTLAGSGAPAAGSAAPPSDSAAPTGSTEPPAAPAAPPPAEPSPPSGDSAGGW